MMTIWFLVGAGHVYESFLLSILRLPHHLLLIYWQNNALTLPASMGSLSQLTYLSATVSDVSVECISVMTVSVVDS
jgi:hypothetical protein